MLGKRLINSNDAAAGGTCTTNTNDYPTTNLAYYKMSSAADEKDTYNGTATDVNFNVQGKFGNAGEFNGSSSYIDSNLQMPSTTTFTFSCWFNKNNSAANYHLIGDFDSSASNASGRFRVQLTAVGNVSVGIGNGANMDFIVFTPTVSLDNIWRHIAVTVDGTSVKLYIDGNQVGTASTSLYSLASGANDFAIGAYNTASGKQNFNGTIDQVRIFNSALNATQVESLYNEVYCVPTIVPTDHFEPFIYPGNGGTKQITTLDFQPDFTWIKNRNNSASSTHAHSLFDSVRTSGYRLVSNTTAAENNYSAYMTGFNSGGFNLSGNPLNDSAGTYVAWSWKAGGAAVQNTDGTITSQVSANVDAGFSIVKYTGNSTAGATVGHGLSSALEMVIAKKTSVSGTNWAVYHTGMTDAPKYMWLNSNAAQAPGTNIWTSTAPTSTVFSIGASSNINTNNDAYIAYAFHSVDGFSKIGSYTGTGATGNTIVTGFRPAFVMIKRTNGTSDWNMWDNRRGNQSILWANGSNQEATNSAYEIIFNSNAFTVNATANFANGSGDSYIFMAFAEEVLPYVTRNATDPFGDSSELALYKFEDDATDAEGNYDATSSPNVTYASGYIDKAAVFNGSSSYISIPQGSLPVGASARTVSMWINTTQTTLAELYGYGIDGNNLYYAVNINAAAGKIGTAFYANDHNFTASVIDGAWHHIVSVYDGNTVEMYVDGQSVGNATAGAVNTSAAGSPKIGKYNYTGSIDQVRIFDRALDDGEVTALYNE